MLEFLDAGCNSISFLPESISDLFLARILPDEDSCRCRCRTNIFAQDHLPIDKSYPCLARASYHDKCRGSHHLDKSWHSS